MYRPAIARPPRGTAPLVPAPTLALALLALLLAVIAPRPAAAAEQVRISHRGMSLLADLQIASGSELSDGVLLMTHGTLAHGRMEIMATLQDLLAERGINSLSITLSLGQSERSGMYDCASLHDHRHSDAAAEIALWYDWLVARGAGPISLLGHSRGGAQTAEFAAAPNRHGGAREPAGAVLVAPAVWWPGKLAEDYQHSHEAPLAPVLKRAGELVEAGRGDEVLEDTDFVYCAGARVTAATFVDWYSGRQAMDAPSSVAASRLPVLVVAGSDDAVVAELPERMQGVADGERVRFEVIDGAEHFFRDLYAEDLADLVEEFVAGL